MNLKQIAEELGLKILNEEVDLEREVTGGYVSDLLSDVMGNAREGELWITLQSHINVVAIASLKDLAGIVLVKGILPDSLMLEKAREEGIPVLATTRTTFQTTGLIYKMMES